MRHKVVLVYKRSRPEKWEPFVTFLRALSARSTCQRAQHACVVTDPEYSQVYAIGYNGRAIGEKHGCSSLKPGKCGCVHAETNALVKLRTERRDLVLWCTSSPCELCARLIVNSRAIAKCIFLAEYRDPKPGLEVLNLGVAWQFYHKPLEKPVRRS